MPSSINQSTPDSGLSLMVADGGSTDGTGEQMVAHAFAANSPESNVCWRFGWVSAVCVPLALLAGWLETNRFFENAEWGGLALYLLVPIFLGLLATLGAFFVGLAELFMWMFSRKQQPTCWRIFAGMGLACLLPISLIPTTTVTSVESLRIDDLNRLRQIALASMNYESAHGYFPPLAGCTEKPGAKGKGLSWRVHILPFLEKGDLYDRFRLDEPWDSHHNIQLLEEMPEIYASRWPRQQPPAGYTLYQRPVGHGAFDPGDRRGIRIEEITDGISHTIFAVQVDTTYAVPWTKPADYKFNPADPIQGLGHAVHHSGWLAVLCDGFTHTIDSEGRSSATLRAMFTRDADDQDLNLDQIKRGQPL